VRWLDGRSVCRAVLCFCGVTWQLCVVCACLYLCSQLSTTLQLCLNGAAARAVLNMNDHEASEPMLFQAEQAIVLRDVLFTSLSSRSAVFLMPTSCSEHLNMSHSSSSSSSSEALSTALWRVGLQPALVHQHQHLARTQSTEARLQLFVPASTCT